MNSLMTFRMDNAMNNIRIERVLNAYSAMSIKPSFEGWGNKGCACAIAAIAIHENRETFPDIETLLDNLNINSSADICKSVNITWPYMLGFTDAYDGCSFGTSDQKDNAEVLWGDRERAEYHMGYDHGKAARSEVEKHYVSDPDLDEDDISSAKYALNAINEAKYYVDDASNKLLELVGTIYEEIGSNLSAIYQELEKIESELINTCKLECSD